MLDSHSQNLIATIPRKIDCWNVWRVDTLGHCGLKNRSVTKKIRSKVENGLQRFESFLKFKTWFELSSVMKTKLTSYIFSFKIIRSEEKKSRSDNDPSQTKIGDAHLCD